MDKITHIEADGWQALYLNGDCIDQGHSVNFSVVMEYLSAELGFQFEEGWAQDWADNNGGFPENILIESVTYDG